MNRIGENCGDHLCWNGILNLEERHTPCSSRQLIWWEACQTTGEQMSDTVSPVSTRFQGVQALCHAGQVGTTRPD